MGKANNFCADIGYLSLNHAGEQLCGDHVEAVSQGEASSVIVLADGLGSGVKASILSTLTARIISTMLAAGLRLEDAVETIAATLPVCATRGIAYSTFTILRIQDNERAEIIEYDNPAVILLRGGRSVELPCVWSEIGGKRIRRSDVALQKDDVFLLMSDGVEHAGVGRAYNFGWRREAIAAFLETLWHVGFSARALAAVLLRETDRLYGGLPGDDATVCAVRIRERYPVNVLCGPPANPADCEQMLADFFRQPGARAVCGGTTSNLAADYLRRPLHAELVSTDPEVPPIGTLEGVDLVTEGVLTINRVLTYARDYLGENRLLERWSEGKDGASRLARLLFEEATDVSLYIGCAVNPAHQSAALPAGFFNKTRLLEELAQSLEKMGKRVSARYW